MKLIEDGGVFDDMQQTLIGSLIESIKGELDSENISPEIARSLLEKISFSISVILDGSRDATFKGEEAFPVLTFQDEDDNLISSGCGSSMHEYVFGIIKELHSNETS